MLNYIFFKNKFSLLKYQTDIHNWPNQLTRGNYRYSHNKYWKFTSHLLFNCVWVYFDIETKPYHASLLMVWKECLIYRFFLWKWAKTKTIIRYFLNVLKPTIDVISRTVILNINLFNNIVFKWLLSWGDTSILKFLYEFLSKSKHTHTHTSIFTIN